MNKLSEGTIAFIKLFLRSKDIGEGWRHVSKMITPNLKTYAPTDLFDVSYNGDGTARIRLTERGKVIADYV